MRVLFLALCLLAWSACAQSTGPRMETFQQKLDHFSSSPSQSTWTQRITVQDEFWLAGNRTGPIWIFLSGEAPMEFFEFQEVQIINWARQYNALYYVIEHRFYGESNPIPGPDPYTSQKLELLSSRQALADAANFIQSKKTQLGASNPWVVWGCSYSGALSAWFRKLYPDLVVASVAPSGPVLAQSNYTSFFHQFETSAGPQCANDARVASHYISELSQHTVGRGQLAHLFGACESVVAEEDLYYFLWSIMSSVGSADQMDNPSNQESPNQPNRPFILNTTCDILANKTMNPIEAFAAAFKFNNNPSAPGPAFKTRAIGAPQCTSFVESAWLKQLQDPSNENRSWWWQKCSEFGFFKGSYCNSDECTSVFFGGLDVEHIVGYCGQIFGRKGMKPDIAGTNAFYGGKQLDATNVLFTNGLLDPWHLLSITEQEGGVDAVTYEAGHCAPLTKPTPIDPPSLVQARQRVESFLDRVLHQQ